MRGEDRSVKGLEGGSGADTYPLHKHIAANIRTPRLFRSHAAAKAAGHIRIVEDQRERGGAGHGSEDELGHQHGARSRGQHELGRIRESNEAGEGRRDSGVDVRREAVSDAGALPADSAEFRRPITQASPLFEIDGVWV
jgi:hypothetical protein